ncbi:MAG: hypothetical protein ACRCT1_01720 [Microcoleaceae cyanobacterium]
MPTHPKNIKKKRHFFDNDRTPQAEHLLSQLRTSNLSLLPLLAKPSRKEYASCARSALLRLRKRSKHYHRTTKICIITFAGDDCPIVANALTWHPPIWTSERDFWAWDDGKLSN